MELTLSEVKPIIKYIIENNKELAKKNVKPIAIGLTGHAGLGKSSILQQIADEIDANYIFLSLSQITETSELIGYPLKEHYVCKHTDDIDECRWITAELIEAYARSGWEITDDTRMGYAIPQWLKGLDPNKPTIVNMDDITRASNIILNSAMEIVLQQKFISWQLPENTTVVLSSNPSDGSYTVNEVDEAFQSRYINFDVKFDIRDWSRYAENVGLDSRAINFLLTYHNELMERKNNITPPANARSYTMFANTISGIKDWEKPESLMTILQIASGCFIDKDNIVGGLFTQFINRKLDKLIEPEKLLLGKWEIIKEQIKNCVYTGDTSNPHNYHPEIASILGTRLLNYTEYYFGQKKAKTEPVQTRLLELIDSDVKLFSEDIIFNIIKNLVAKYPARTNKLILNPKVRARIV